MTIAFWTRLACAAVASALCACSAPASGDAAHPRAAAARIVSLMPSLTEDLCRVGAAGQIVGVSQFSDDIPCVRGVPQVAGFASVDAERIIALHPDAVFAIPAQRRMTEPLRRAGLRLVFVKDDAFGDIFTDLRAAGELTGHETQAAQAVRELRAETKRLRAAIHGKHRPAVFVALGAGPIWTVGPSSYIAALLRLAGAENAVRSLPAAYGQYSAEALLKLQPDAILTDNATGVAQALDREPWRSLRAVRERRVFVLSQPSIVERPGPRYNEGLHWLIAALRPLER